MEFKWLEETLESAHSGIGAERFLKESALAGAALALIALCLGFFYAHSWKIALFSLPAFFLPGALRYFYTLYIIERRKLRIGEEVPDLLLLASSMPPGTGVEKVIGFMASTSSGPLGEEFRATERQILSGMPVHEALHRMKMRNGSQALSRALDLIISALNTGAEMNAVFREAAEDSLETNSMLRERAAGMTVEKWTLLLAGGVIVPLVLGLITGMVSGMDFTTISELGIGMPEKQRIELVEASMLANIVYIFEYAVLASCFVAFQEGGQKKAVVYAMALVPLGMLVYLLGKGF